MKNKCIMKSPSKAQNRKGVLHAMYQAFEVKFGNSAKIIVPRSIWIMLKISQLGSRSRNYDLDVEVL